MSSEHPFICTNSEELDSIECASPTRLVLDMYHSGKWVLMVEAGGKDHWFELEAPQLKALAERDREVERLTALLQKAHPARVWDMARQHYTAEPRTYPSIESEWHLALCREVDAAQPAVQSKEVQP